MADTNKTPDSEALITAYGDIYQFPKEARTRLTAHLRQVYTRLARREDRLGSSGRDRLSAIRRDLSTAARQYAHDHFTAAKDEYLESPDSPTIKWERDLSDEGATASRTRDFHCDNARDKSDAEQRGLPFRPNG